MDDTLCRKCGLPIDNKEDVYGVFEGMHWLCFHFVFEHGDFPKDKRCEDPSCPIHDCDNKK